MKRMVVLMCLLPSLVLAQINSTSTSTSTVGGRPTSLIRLSAGRDCQVYPGSFFKPNSGGTVQMNYTVQPDGRVGTVTVTSSSGDRQIDSGAVDCVKSWKFLPPQQIGKESLTGQAMVTYAADDHGNFRNGSANWRAPGIREAADLAVSDLTNPALKCLHDKSGIPEAAAEARQTTVYRLNYFRGEIARVQIMASSGNDRLDKAGG